jgi:hypothetical protein
VVYLRKVRKPDAVRKPRVRKPRVRKPRVRKPRAVAHVRIIDARKQPEDIKKLIMNSIRI